MNKKAIGKKVINSKTMNRKVIEALFEQFAVPSPQRKREFLKKYRRLEFGHLEFLVIQIWYIHWCVWVISIMLSGLMLGALICAGRDMTWNFSSVSALIPFLALLAIMEVRKSGLCRMEELELPCRISLHGGGDDADQHGALDLIMLQNGNNQQAQQGQQSGQSHCHKLAAGNGPVDIHELQEGVGVILQNTGVLEADKSDEQADTGGDGFLQAIGQGLGDLGPQSGNGQRHKDDAGHQNNDQTGLVAGDRALCRRSRPPQMPAGAG